MKDKKGFSLIELIVVIAIIGILAGVMLVSVSSGSDSARAARCLTNMRSLATACQSYGMASSFYPAAGSLEYFTMDVKQGKRNVKEIYNDYPGWISWNSEGAYKSRPTASKASPGWITSCYNQNEKSRYYAITNGALWKYVSGNHEVYICPQHSIVKKKLKPNWSYVMNAYFGWTASPGTEYYTDDGLPIHWYRDFQRADRFLLFAEISFADIGGKSPEDTTGFTCDAVLQYKGLENCKQNESIGFNHRVGKNTFANVVFADGHTEKITYPKTELTTAAQQELTKWLCTGKDVSFDGKKYENMTNDD